MLHLGVHFMWKKKGPRIRIYEGPWKVTDGLVSSWGPRIESERSGTKWSGAEIFRWTYGSRYTVGRF